MSWKRGSFALLLATGLGVAQLAQSGSAWALTCGSNSMQVPTDGATQVPTNTRLWSYGRFGGAGAARLVGPEGEVPVVVRFLPAVISAGSASHFPMTTPVDELEPNTLYSIEVESLSGSIDVTSFTTGDGPALGAPALPEVLSREQHAGRGWLGGVNRSVELELSFQGILIADTLVDWDADPSTVDLAAAGVLGEVRSVDDLLLEESATFGGFSTSPLSPAVWFMTDRPEQGLDAASGDCGTWPEFADDRIAIRMGVMDLAGNFSGWIPEVLELPSREEALSLVEAAEAEVLADQEALEAQRAVEGEALRDEIRAARRERGHNFGSASCSMGLPGRASGGSGLSLSALALAWGVAVSRSRGAGRWRLQSRAGSISRS